MNFLQLCQRLRLEVGLSGSGPTSVVGTQTEESQRLINWINAAWVDIQSAHQDWQWLRTSCSFNTVAGQALYATGGSAFSLSITQTGGVATATSITAHGLVTGDLVTVSGANQAGYNLAGATVTVTGANTYTYAVDPATASPATGTITGFKSTNILLPDFGMWARDTFRNYVTADGLRSEVLMAYKDYESWRNAYQFGNLRYSYSRPLEITIAPDKSIGLGPVPIAGYTVIGDYYRAPSEMALDADVPALPTQFHLAIVYKAMMHYGVFESAPEVYQRGEQEFDKLMSRMTLDRLPEMVIGGALA